MKVKSLSYLLVICSFAIPAVASTIVALPDGFSPVGLNSSGQVTGYYAPNDGTRYEAAIYQQESLTVLSSPSDGTINVAGINDAGTVVGTVRSNWIVGAGWVQAVFWSGGEMHYVDSGGSAYASSGSAIHASGQIVGEMAISSVRVLGSMMPAKLSEYLTSPLTVGILSLMLFSTRVARCRTWELSAGLIARRMRSTGQGKSSAKVT